MKKQKLNIIILTLVTFIVSYFVLKDNFMGIMKLIKNINLFWFALSILLVLAYWTFQTLCISSLNSANKKKISFKTLYKSEIACHFFSAITPSASGGQPFQIYYLKDEGLDIGTATNLVVEQSTLYQVALVMIGLTAIILNYFFNFFPSDVILKKLVILGFLVNFAVILILGYVTLGKKSNKFIILRFVKFLHRIKIIRHEEKALAKVEKTIDEFYISAKALNSNKKALIKGITYNILGILCLYATPIFIFYSLGDFTSLNLVAVIVCSAYTMLISAFIPIPGASGGVEYAFAAFFGYFVAGPILLAALLIWRFVTYYMAIIFGVLLMMFNKKEEHK